MGLRGSVGSTQPVWLNVSMGEKTSAGGVQLPKVAPPEPALPLTPALPAVPVPALPLAPPLLLPEAPATPGTPAAALPLAPALPAAAPPLPLPLPELPPAPPAPELGSELPHAASKTVAKIAIVFG